MRSVSALLAFTDGDVWRPGIGDPTVMGWVTVIAYFAVALFCILRLRAGGAQSGKRPENLFWGGLAALLVGLGINKQLDLQTWLTLTVRRIAIDQGWYDQRRSLQFVFIIFVGLIAFAGLVFLWRLVRRNREMRIPLFGLILLLAFVIVRAASFHHMDTLINLHFRGVRMNWILELGAIAVIGVGACHNTRGNSGAPGSVSSSAKIALS